MSYCIKRKAKITDKLYDVTYIALFVDKNIFTLKSDIREAFSFQTKEEAEKWLNGNQALTSDKTIYSVVEVS